MTGLPTLLVELDDGTGTFPYNITPYVRLKGDNGGWDFERGRQDEDDQVEAKTLKLTLKNNDGRFSLGSAAYGCRIDQRIRLKETVGASTYERFRGYALDWPTEWPTNLTFKADTTITVSDRPNRLERRKLRSVVENEIMEDTPVAYYTFGDPAGSQSATDSSGLGGAPLVMTGTGTDVTFGAAIGPGTDDLTAAQFSAGKSLLRSAFARAAGDYTVACFFSCSAATGSTQILINLETAAGATNGLVIAATTGQLQGPSTTSAGSVCDGLLHHAAFVMASGTGTLYLDGVAVSSGAASVPAHDVLRVGSNNGNITTFNGVIAHVAVYTSALSPSRVASIASAGSTGFSTERSDQRVARLATYANIAPADQNLETGSTSNLPNALTAGQSAMDALRNVESAEGGLLFTNGSGQLTFHNRQHRVLKSTQTPALALVAGDVDGLRISGAREYLVNTVTGARINGATQRVADAASVLLYEEYADDLGTLLVSTDAEVLDHATWVVAMYKDPRPRISALVLDLLTLPQATVQAALALELGDRITLASLPSQAPASFGGSADLIVEGLREHQEIDAWTLTLNTVPSALFRAWILGDATYGQLGSTTRLFY